MQTIVLVGISSIVLSFSRTSEGNLLAFGCPPIRIIIVGRDALFLLLVGSFLVCETSGRRGSVIRRTGSTTGRVRVSHVRD